MCASLDPNVLAEELIGRSVRSRTGDDVGSVRDVLRHSDTGCIAYVLVTFGGVFGMGGKLFPVPFDAIQVANDGALVLPVEKQRLPEAPDVASWTAAVPLDRETAAAVRSFYGAASNFGLPK